MVKKFHKINDGKCCESSTVAFFIKSKNISKPTTLQSIMSKSFSFSKCWPYHGKGLVGYVGIVLMTRSHGKLLLTQFDIDHRLESCDFKLFNCHHHHQVLFEVLLQIKEVNRPLTHLIGQAYTDSFAHG